MVSKAQKTCTLIRYTIRVFLSRAGDIYVKSLAGSGSNIAYGNTMGCPTPQMSAVPRSFRTVDEELRTRRSSTMEQSKRSRPSPAGVVEPTRKVVFGRIDEEGDADAFVEGDGVGLLRKARPDQVYASTQRSKAKMLV